MKTNLRVFIIGISLFITLFIVALFLPQADILNNLGEIEQLSLILLIAVMFLAGILDGFNPCAFSTLLLWVGFLLNNFGKQIDGDVSVKEKQKSIYGFVFFYSLGIFSIYFLLGSGIMLASEILKPSMILNLTRIAGFIIVVMGLLMIRDAISKSKNPIIKMPKFLYPLYTKYSKPTTKFASFISGIVIGLCTVPCSGAIYMAAILILNKEPFMTKYPVLFIYNIGFILPVVILAITISNKKLLTYISQDFVKSKKFLKVLIAIITIILGLIATYMV